MSYDRTAVVGWFARFTLCPDEKVVSTTTSHECEAKKKHKFPKGATFCPTCGSPIVEVKVDVISGWTHPQFIVDERDQETIDELTLGHATVQDIEALGDVYVLCPEYLNTEDVIIFAPGYETASDVSRNDGTIREVESLQAPSEEWIASIRKAFNVENVKVSYGLGVDVR